MNEFNQTLGSFSWCFPNVAQVAPQVHVTTSTSFSTQSSLPNYSMPGVPSSSTQTTLSSHSTSSNPTSHQTASSLPHTTTSSHSAAATPPTSTGGESALSLSNLIGSQNFDSQSSGETSTSIPSAAHATPSLDYLNYSLSGGTSAFRRPDFPSALSSDLQSLLTSPSSQLTTGSLPTPPPAHSNSSPSVTSGSFTPQSSAYSQYAAAYRPHSAAPGFRSPATMTPGAYSSYTGQYPYPSQYAGLTPHSSTTQPPSMAQYGSLQTTSNPYQTYPAPGTGLPPYSPGLSGFGHGPYPPM